MYPDCCLTNTALYWCCAAGALVCHVVHRHGSISIVSWYVDLRSDPFGRATFCEYDLLILDGVDDVDDDAFCRPLEVDDPKQMTKKDVGR